MLKQFCSRCGQPVEADDGWAGHRMACPGCGATMQWPGGNVSNQRRQILTALVVLLLLAALVLLLLQPTRFGSGGGGAREGVFGRGLVGLLGGDGRDPKGDPASSGETNTAPTIRNAVNPPAAPAPSPATPPASASPVANPQTNSPPPALSPAPVTATNVATTNPPILPVGAPGSVRLNDDFSQRLSAAGAKTGDVQISLIWNNLNDLDLHCVDPSREEIYFQNRRSSTGGVLDVDRNARHPWTTTPVENIYWPQSGAPPGEYQVYVDYYAWQGGADPTAYKVRILVRGQEMVFTGSISRGQRNRFIHRFTLPPNR